MKKPKIISKKEIAKVGVATLFEVTVDIGTKKKKVSNVAYPEVVVVVPMLDKNTVIMGKEYRPMINKTLYGFPGGKADKENNLLQAAKRELMEEVGYICGTIKKVISYYPLVGLTTARVHIYIAKNLKKVEQDLDDDEYITPTKIKLSDVPRLIKSGKIAESKTLIGLMALGVKLN